MSDNGAEQQTLDRAPDFERLVSQLESGQPFDRAEVGRLLAAYGRLYVALKGVDAIVQGATADLSHDVIDDAVTDAFPTVQKVHAKRRARRN